MRFEVRDDELFSSGPWPSLKPRSTPNSKTLRFETPSPKTLSGLGKKCASLACQGALRIQVGNAQVTTKPGEYCIQGLSRGGGTRSLDFSSFRVQALAWRV